VAAANAAVAFIVAFVVARLLVSRFAHFGLDHPNERSLHEQPVPRTGGIAVLAGAGVSLISASPMGLAVGIAVALAAVSLVDDLHGLPTAGRLVAHLAAAGFFAWYVLAPMALLELALIVLAIAWLTNLYNFMDGSDGLAGGMALVGFGTYAIAAYFAGHPGLALLSGALAAASAAFLLHNFHPARIFLGDVGSIPLGFLAGALGIQGWRDDAWPLWFPVLVFGPFIGDATLTLLRRLLRGERVWQPHREHYYQRMVRMGIGHRRTALAAYAVMFACATAALVGRALPVAGQTAAFFAGAGLLAAIAAWVDVKWSRFLRAPERPA
jgi:UDP-N-acetylmuramyl pentapeptide phosphotransferase/UDP-N-acetylglucosamine-1-phosphate transferase